MERNDKLHKVTQSFCYDNMNRLRVTSTNSICGAGTSDDFSYDELGNITSNKNIAGSYGYGASAGPHAVTSVGNKIYTYDANGNLDTATQGVVQQTVEYSAFNKPINIARINDMVPEASTTIIYGPDKQRIKRVDSSGRTTRYIWVLEETIYQGTTERVHTIGNAVQYVERTGTINTDEHVLLLRDHIGSVSARIPWNTAANDLEYLANDAWGNRVQAYWGQVKEGTGFEPGYSARGFTDHEHLDGVGLIHMNGRVYDPEIGRFLSPDPFVPAPDNSQAYNRYSYVFNNPLSNTDPSGYCPWGFGCGMVNSGTYTSISATNSVGETIRSHYTDSNQNAAMSHATSNGSYVGEINIYGVSGMYSQDGGFKSDGVASYAGVGSGNLEFGQTVNSETTNFSSQYASASMEEIVVNGYMSGHPAGPRPLNFNSYIDYFGSVPVWTSTISILPAPAARYRYYGSAAIARINAPYISNKFYFNAYAGNPHGLDWNSAAGQATKVLAIAMAIPLAAEAAEAAVAVGAEKLLQGLTVYGLISAADSVHEVSKNQTVGNSYRAGVNLSRLAIDVGSRFHPAAAVVGTVVSETAGAIPIE